MKYIYWITGCHWRYEYYLLLKFKGMNEEMSFYYASRAIKKNYLEVYRNNPKSNEFKDFMVSDLYKKCKL